MKLYTFYFREYKFILFRNSSTCPKYTNVYCLYTWSQKVMNCQLCSFIGLHGFMCVCVCGGCIWVVWWGSLLVVVGGHCCWRAGKQVCRQVSRELGRQVGCYVVKEGRKVGRWVGTYWLGQVGKDIVRQLVQERNFPSKMFLDLMAPEWLVYTWLYILSIVVWTLSALSLYSRTSG